MLSIRTTMASDSCLPEPIPVLPWRVLSENPLEGLPGCRARTTRHSPPPRDTGKRVFAYDGIEESTTRRMVVVSGEVRIVPPMYPPRGQAKRTSEKTRAAKGASATDRGAWVRDWIRVIF